MANMTAQACQKVSRHGIPGDRQYSVITDDGRLSDFIRHPSAFPLGCKRLWFGREENHSAKNEKTIGLYFRPERYLKLGINVEMSIPLRGEI